ncbi:nucleotidyltransferase family protein [candidate division KSB1 bacterium]|nr:nucleotidyltransferase family protein [candidate division KSB1 bacterium]
MKALILAAGYATRLYPLTKDKPKPLLKVGEKTILDHLIGKIITLPVETIYIVTNERFTPVFQKWSENVPPNYPEIIIINDGTTSNETRLGAIADIQFVIDQAGINDHLLVAAGDNVYTFNFLHMYELFLQKQANVILTFPVENLEKLKRSGVVEVDDRLRVIGFEEKPDKPRSNLVCPALYMLQRPTCDLFSVYLKGKNNPDAPGFFIKWLYQQIPVFAFIMKEKYFDIGTLESYKRVCAELGEEGTRKNKISRGEYGTG